MDSESDNEIPTLSTSALDALKEFFADRDARQKQFEDLKAVAEEDASSGPGKTLSMDAFAENWNESQFWYSDETASILANELLRGANAETVIGVVSAPSVFVQLKNILAASGKSVDQRPKLWLFEFDERFEVFPEFVPYDFNDPVKLPPALRGSMDHIICDPPFLSEECQTKAAMTVRWLFKSWGATPLPETKLIVCTGERMESLMNKLYRPQGIATTNFEPVHSKGLSNEFFCYANFECESWKWREQKSSS